MQKAGGKGAQRGGDEDDSAAAWRLRGTNGLEAAGMVARRRAMDEVGDGGTASGGLATKPFASDRKRERERVTFRF